MKSENYWPTQSRALGQRRRDREFHFGQCPDPCTSAIFSHWLGLTWKEYGLAWKAEIFPGESTNRRLLGSCILASEQQIFLIGKNCCFSGQMRKIENKKSPRSEG